MIPTPAFPNSPLWGQHFLWPAVQNIDTSTTLGEQTAKAALLAFTDTTVAICLKNHVNGVSIWDTPLEDIPGKPNDFSHLEYVGDCRPECLPPWFDQSADQMFGKFTSRGIRVGVCLRHNEITQIGGRATRIRGNGVQSLIDKASYARDRWGCDLNYVDTNYLDELDAIVPGTPNNEVVLPANWANMYQARVGKTDVVWEQTKDYWGNGYQYWDCGLGSPVMPNAATPLAIAKLSLLSAANQAALLPPLVKAGCKFWVPAWEDGHPDLIVAQAASKGITY